MPQDAKIAPRELIQADYRGLRSAERLDTTAGIEELIFMQSMEGRAHNGAGAFHKRFFVNTSIDDIVRGLDKSPDVVKEKRQRLIDEITDFARRVIAGERPNRLVSKKATPLLGIPLFKTKVVNPYEVLKGLYLGGLRDSPPTRREAEKIYGTTIGYGSCYLVNIEVMDRMGLDGEILAHQAHEAEIENFRKQGLIADPAQFESAAADKLRYFYIRHKLGPGQSDDAAIVCAGFLYKSVDVALGVFLADAIDTLEKYVPRYSDQDRDLAEYIGANFRDLNVTPDEVHRLTYLAAIPEGKEEEVPDSSLRYFLTIDPRTGQSTIECHLNFIEGKPFFPMAVSYKRILITTFYEYLRERLYEVLKPEEILPIGAPGEELDIPIKDLIRKKVLVVDELARLSEVLRKLREMEADVVVIQDKKKNIVGVVDSNDFLHILEGKR